jgi:tripartite-type tricarboxylate transporter receptor subunit TctC
MTTLTWGARALGTTSFAILAAFGATTATAQQFPSEPIRIVIGFAAGGSTDTNTRALAAAAQQTCGTEIVITNQPGGSGVIALDTVRRSAPDGYTIATTPTEISAVSHMGLSDITHRDFSAVMRFVFDPHGFFVRPDSPYKSLQDIVNAATAGATIRVATSGPASPYAITFEDLARHAGVSGRLINIPYQGDAMAIPAALSGEVDLLVTNASNARGHVAENTLVPLGVASDTRIGIFPDTPTLIEQGIDVTGGSIFGLAVPAGTPGERVAALNACFEAAFRSDMFNAYVAQSGVNPSYLSAAEYDAYLAAEYDRYGELLRQLGLAQ